MPTKSKARPFEELALDLLKQAKEKLRTNKSFTATVFLVYSSSVEIFELPFQGAQQLYASFTNVVEIAVRTNAEAIISITDQRVKTLPSKTAREQFLKRYRHGDLEAEKAPEALGMIVSPRCGPDWGLSVAYKRNDDTGSIVYGRAKSNTLAPYKNNLIPEGWKSSAKAEPAKRKVPQSSRT